ncbi:MAG: EamA family transporter [Pegethrix bostrychoides GSE-TBD4-15B]|jgi:drug/metabolite transporter (DMT)-like permease/cell division protein FtsB|uniref:EamA family transporter n=1 Tax=Pegethrix bostrychoides GSE-TBD4-15B TaxID=2839662 RepID=A0A951U6A4_9CYAN|nr:EamA family transporter [Pegethrix bostrychoides GSE-TBD4-15B]
MGRFENVPEQKPGENGLSHPTDAPQAAGQAGGQAGGQTAEMMLQSVTQDLRSLQQDLLAQLNQDVSRLQAEKTRLANDIEQLQSQQQALQSQQSVELSRQQLAQQQAWAKQLALVLANHLQTALNERLNQTLGAPQISSAPAESSHQVMASLDDTVNRTFASLRHDINSYQSSLGQQLERMHTMGQQGEAILEVLVKRLSQQLQAEAGRGGTGLNSTGLNPTGKSTPRSPFAAPSPREIAPAAPAISPTMPPNALTAAPERLNPFSRDRITPPRPAASPSWSDALKASASRTAQTNAPPIEFGSLESTEFEISDSIGSLDDLGDLGQDLGQAEAAAEQPAARLGRRRISLKQGLSFVLLSTVVMSLHYVGVGILGNSSQLFGQQAIGGYLSLAGFSNAALLLWIRMLVVVPLLLWLSSQIYPATLRDLRAFTQSGDRRGLWGVLISGTFLFLSQVLLYLAIGKIGPGAAIATLFVYPVGVLLLNWMLFAERLTLNRLGIMLAIVLGMSLTVSPLLAAESGGILGALLAALAFTFYLISMQLTARKLHPVPVSLVQFASMFVLSSLSLIVMGIKGSVNWSGLLVGGVILGLLTVGSYALNHFGVRAIGAARSSIIAASTPAVTALLAFFLVPGALTTLSIVQIAGILLVTLGGTALGLERMLLQNQAARQAKLREQEAAGEMSGVNH